MWLEIFQLFLSNKRALKRILKMEELIMSKIDELNGALNHLQSSVSAAVAKIDELKAGQATEAQLEEARANVEAAASALDAAVNAANQ
jgi:hypothetical protein